VLVAELEKAKTIARNTQDARRGLQLPQLAHLPVATAAAMEASPALAGEQQRLQDTILQGPAVNGAAVPWVRPKADFPAVDQVAVYINAYRSRLYEVTAEDFPVLQHYLGEERFDALVRGFVDQTQSVHFNIARYSSGLPAYLAQVMPQDGLARELAALEDAICQLQDEPETAALTQQHLTEWAAEDILHVALGLRAASRLFAFTYPVDAYYTAVREEHSPAVPEPQASYLLVYRHDDVVWRMNLEEGEHKLLQALASGVSVGDACAALEAQTDGAGEAMDSSVMRWFSRWIRNGVIRRPIVEQVSTAPI